MTATDSRTFDDPAALLTLVQAADWAQVSLASVQRALGQGALRFEVVRQKDREVQRIRLVDLQDWVATLRPTPAAPSDASAEPRAPQEPAPTESTPEADPETELSQAAAPAESTEGPSALSLRRPEEWEGALGWLRDQQEELREQCLALRQRLVRSEAERQRALEALVQWQDRWSHSLPAVQSLARPWWRRPSLWVACGLAFFGWWTLRGSVEGVGERLAQEQTVWAAEWSAATQEQQAFEARRRQAERTAWQQTWQTWVEDQELQRQVATEQVQSQAQASQSWRSQWDQRWEEWQGKLSSTERERDLQQQQELARRSTWEQEQSMARERREAALLELVQGELREQGLATDRLRREFETAWQAREARALAESQRLLAGWQAAEASAAQQQRELGDRTEAWQRERERWQQETRVWAHQAGWSLWRSLWPRVWRRAQRL